MKTIALSCFVLLGAGCASWPDHGRGGFAEHSGLDRDEFGLQSARSADLVHAFAVARLELDVLVLQGARYCIPARVELARQQQVRTERVIAAGHFDDAENDMVVFHRHIDDTRRRFDYLTAHTECAAPPVSIPKHSDAVSANGGAIDTTAMLREKLVLLLNSHTQFDTASAELLPQYQHALQLAASALKDQPVEAITVHGHTDDVGNEPGNVSLGRRRAEAVRDALIHSGLPETWFAVESSGERAPIAPNTTGYGRLANRRVEVSVRFANNAAKTAQVTPIIVKQWSDVTEDYDLERGVTTQ